MSHHGARLAKQIPTTLFLAVKHRESLVLNQGSGAPASSARQRFRRWAIDWTTRIASERGRRVGGVYFSEVAVRQTEAGFILILHRSNRCMVSTIRRHFNTIKTRTGKNLMITDIMASEQEPEETQESDTEDDESGATTVRFEPSGAPESSLPRWMREKPGDVVMKEESRTTLSSEPMPSDRGTAWWPELHPERAYPR